MSLDRFHRAQGSSFSGYAGALAELRAGRKTSHWVWYIFPQLAGLGRSGTAQRFAIRDRDEAVAYLGDAVLRERLVTAAAAIARHLHAGAALVDVMGGTLDAQKLGTYQTSIVPDEDCCTLFTPRYPTTHARPGEAEVAESALDIPTLVEGAIREAALEEFRFPMVDWPAAPIAENQS